MNNHDINSTQYLTDDSYSGPRVNVNGKWQRRSRKLQERRWRTLNKHYKHSDSFARR